MDDELIGFIFKFTSTITNELHTNLTGVHEVFKLASDSEQQEPLFMMDYEIPISPTK